MGVVTPMATRAVHTERTTVHYLAVENVPDATVQLRAAVDLDINAAPGEYLALPLTRDQAHELLQGLAAHLGHRVIGIRR
ncbi:MULTISPECIES: hypothetical protein [unclassified Kitasatospora]|uniref:hypothetical protein n=1 Tax=unclassified Kitasatospora TaxID=2633591 RepID=UPI001AE08277|nr:hypothetical protein [Kitasatospora sp. RG8]MBP0450008.1 hypothetical protein [Kitasatospora sp. RG8]